MKKHRRSPAEIQKQIEPRASEWEALGVMPTEPIPDGLKTSEPLRYGMRNWKDLFLTRQLLCHCLSVEVFHELVDEERAKGTIGEVTSAAFIYLAIALDKLVDRNTPLSHAEAGSYSLRGAAAQTGVSVEF